MTVLIKPGTVASHAALHHIITHFICCQSELRTLSKPTPLQCIINLSKLQLEDFKLENCQGSLYYTTVHIYCGKISRYANGIKSKILLLQWRLTSSDVGRWNLGVQFSMLRVGQSLELLVSLGWSVGQDNVR